MPDTRVSSGGSDGALPPVQYPAWMDASYMLAISEVQTDDVAIGAGATVLAVGGNARRFGLGFVASSANAADIHLSTSGDPSTFPFLTLAKGASVWLTLSNMGPMVPYEWYAHSTGAASLRVIWVELGG